MRDRRQILGPLHLLLSEAGSHLRDAHVAAGEDATDVVKQAHARSLACPFFTAYRDNEVVNLVELKRWIADEVLALGGQTEGHLKAAFEAYSCALGFVETLVGIYGFLIVPAAETKPGLQASC